ncbi:Rieske 2Fe-2S domain-containing protein [Micromonospora rifamycinica]|uniref:Rieske 2Fe-2S domain-containing protein n=1 Tax=Micromonospora rifamycinica TaxID=291594 RepID=UPI002E2A5BCA|nr:Rieske 2Fe-2S domain-containing protein [Micromonospora rifamycinica]
MPVLTFAAEGAGNCVTVRDAPYVFARTTKGSFVLPARCAHRGGPLHLATFDGGTRLICPWHGRATSVTRAVRTGIPAVRRGRIVTAVFSGTVDPEHAVGYRPMSPCLTAGRPRPDQPHTDQREPR